MVVADAKTRRVNYELFIFINNEVRWRVKHRWTARKREHLIFRAKLILFFFRATVY